MSSDFKNGDNNHRWIVWILMSRNNFLKLRCIDEHAEHRRNGLFILALCLKFKESKGGGIIINGFSGRENGRAKKHDYIRSV